MAVLVSDGFDQYLVADLPGPWNGSSSVALSNVTPFNSGQCFRGAQSATGNSIAFTTGTNESTVYGSLRWIATSVSTSTSGILFQDGAVAAAGTIQCKIVVSNDGNVLIYSGNATLVQTYTGIFNSAVWNSMQFKVVIHPTAGSIEIRLNGAATNTTTNTGMNTRGATANSYANYFGLNGNNAWVDDVFLNNTSGSAPTSWPGDLRAIQQVPSTATQTQFAAVIPSPVTIMMGQNTGTQVNTSGVAVYIAFLVPGNSVLTSMTFAINTTITGHIKIAIFDNTGPNSGPGNVITNGTANVLTNPSSGTQTVTFATPPALVGGWYWVGYDQDVSVTYKAYTTNPSVSLVSTTSYASFPASNPVTSANTPAYPYIYNAITVTAVDNSTAVAQLIEDGDTSYIYSSAVHEDKFSVSAIPATYAVVAVDYYVMWRRSDAGARTCVLSVAANGSSDTALVTSTVPVAYGYAKKTLELDPTGAAWTPATVNGAIIGIAVTA